MSMIHKFKYPQSVSKSSFLCLTWTDLSPDNSPPHLIMLSHDWNQEPKINRNKCTKKAIEKKGVEGWEFIWESTRGKWVTGISLYSWVIYLYNHFKTRGVTVGGEWARGGGKSIYSTPFLPVQRTIEWWSSHVLSTVEQRSAFVPVSTLKDLCLFLYSVVNWNCWSIKIIFICLFSATLSLIVKLRLTFISVTECENWIFCLF